MAKKITFTEKRKFIEVLSDLLDNGFSLRESFDFMRKADLFPKEMLAVFRRNFTAGRPIYQSFAKCGYSSQQISQVQLAETHGNLSATLRGISKQMKLMDKQKKNLRKAVTYPCLLLIFLAGMLAAMRQFLLPQLLTSGMLDPEHIGVRLIRDLPVFLTGFCLALFFLFLMFRLYFRKKSSLARAVFLGSMPIIRRFYQPYLSGYFALEWGKLLQEGMELKQVIHCMKKAKGRHLMHELALQIEENMRRGRPFVKELGKYPFFTREFTKIVQQGEAKGKLGTELLLYSELIWQRFFYQLEQAMTWIQPVIFLIVALLIVLIYAAMLLPIYGNMEGIF